MAASMSDAKVEALGKDVVDWYVRQNPIFATYIGIHDHDSLLPKGTYEAEIEECKRVKEFLRNLEAIDRKGLSPSKRVDYGVLETHSGSGSSSPRGSGFGSRSPRPPTRSGTVSSRCSCGRSRPSPSGSGASRGASNGPPPTSKRRRAGFGRR